MDQSLEFAKLLTRHFAPYPSPDAKQMAALYGHYSLMVRWNRSLNLTRVWRLEESVVRHYCESLFLARQIPAGSVSIADIGSGPGFPGVPIAVVRPECRVALIESHQRKAVFLREATRQMPNVRVLAVRAEDLDSAESDWVVSRAVRWDVVAAVARQNVGLLLGQEDADEALGSGDFDWQGPLPLPWGDRRVLLIGRRR